MGSMMLINDFWYPLYGPIALINHDCKASFEFDIITEKIKKQVEKLKRQPVMIPKESDVYIYNKQSSFKNKEGEELTIDYKFKTHNCLCLTCNTNNVASSLEYSTEYQRKKYSNEYILEEMDEILG